MNILTAHHFTAFAALASLGLAAAPAPAQVFDPPIVDEVLLRLEPGADLDAFLAEMQALVDAGEVIVDDGVPTRDIYLLLWPDELDQAFIDANIVARPDVIWGELNYTSETAEGRVRDFFNAQSFDPSDYNNQSTWDQVNLGNGQQYAHGGGQVVAVLDTGVDASHPDLQSRVLVGWNALDDSNDTSDVGDGVDDDGDGDIDEMVGHGTFMAGLIGHVAPEAEILPVKVLTSDGNSDIFDVAKGWFYAIDNGATVINISLGSTYKCELWEDCLDEATAAGVIVVGAAGNQGLNYEPFTEYPAMLRDAIGVGAVDANDVKADFSNYSICSLHNPDCDDRDQIGLVAPGVGIHSTLPGGMYGQISGTSTAAALVSGTVALMLQQHPEWPRDEFLIDVVRAQLQDAAVDIDYLNHPDYAGKLGAGRLNIGAAIDDTYLGDLDGDGDVDQSDLGILLSCYSHSSCGDLDGDGETDQADLGILLGNYGAGL